MAPPEGYIMTDDRRDSGPEASEEVAEGVKGKLKGPQGAHRQRRHEE
jgi:hypothetical protein